MQFPRPSAHLPEYPVRIGRSVFAALAVWSGLALSGVAQTAEPTRTTATYGNWTVSCALSVPPSGDSLTPVKACEMTTRLNMKGNDGNARPLLQVSIGQPPGAETARIMLQVPVEVALREPVAVSLDQVTASGDAKQPVPQEPLLSATYLACSPRGCLAETAISGILVGRLKVAETMNVTFTSLNGGKRVLVPVSLAGFAQAAVALGLADK